jgi:hypothetical protein
MTEFVALFLHDVPGHMKLEHDSIITSSFTPRGEHSKIHGVRSPRCRARTVGLVTEIITY